MMSLCTKYAVSVMIYSVRASSLYILQLPQIASAGRKLVGPIGSNKDDPDTITQMQRHVALHYYIMSYG